jgi:phage gp29-like protein
MRNYLARAAYAVARVVGGVEVQRATTPRLAAGMGGKVLPELSLWLQFQRVGGALTPQQVSSIIRTADTGDMTRLMDLANDSRQKDCHLQAVLSQAEEAIAELDWKVSVPKNAKRRDVKIARWIEQALRACKGSTDEAKDGFADMIPHLAGAVYYGYAVSETVYRKKDGKIVPQCFVNHAQRRFAFRQSDGAFIWRDDTMAFDGIEVRKDYPGKFVVAMPRVTGDVPCREGLVRVLMWAALFRNWTLSDWLRTGEISWKPWRVGTYDKDASEEDIDDLVTVLANLSTNGTAAIPDTTELKIHWPEGGSGSRNGSHSELFETVGREMSKAVLGQTDTTESSKVGSFAKAKVSDSAEKRRIRSRARYVARVITRDVVRPLVEMNFGRDAFVPEFEFILKDPVELKEFAEGVKALVEAGAQVTQAFVQDTAGMPAPEPGDLLLKPASITAAELKPKPAATPSQAPTEEPGEEPEEPGEEDGTEPDDTVEPAASGDGEPADDATTTPEED